MCLLWQVWFQNRRAKLRRQLKMQNKSNKTSSDKADDAANTEDNLSSEEKKETSGHKTLDSNEEEKISTNQNVKPQENNDTNEKKKRKNSKKKADEQSGSNNYLCLNGKSTKATTIKKNEPDDLSNDYFLDQRTPSPEKSYEQMPQEQGMFVDSNSVIPSYSNWIVSPGKSSVNDPLNSGAGSATDATPSLTSMSPNSVKSPSWGNEMANSQRTLNNHQRLLSQSQNTASLRRRNSNALQSEHFRDYNSMPYNGQSDGFSPNISIHETNFYGQNFHQRGMVSYAGQSDVQQFDYKSNSTSLDLSFQNKGKSGKNGVFHCNGATQCPKPPNSSKATSVSSAASVMAAVYMSSRNPGTYSSQNSYSSRMAPRALQQRIYPSYGAPQQQTYPNDLSVANAYNCSNPLAL